MCNYYKILLLSLIAYLATLSLYPQLDIMVSSLFYNEESNSFPMRHNIVSILIYALTRYLSIAMFFVGAGCFAYDIIVKKIKILEKLKSLREFFKITTRQSFYLSFLYLLIPYFLIHKILKPIWGRARPSQINEFSGIEYFTPIYDLGFNSAFNSFPSGHASMAFSMLAIYFVIPDAKKGRWGIILFLWAVLGSFNRVVMGGHYLSDVLASAIITCFAAVFLKKTILK